jgi:hypothetical protein
MPGEDSALTMDDEFDDDGKPVWWLKYAIGVPVLGFAAWEASRDSWHFLVPFAFAAIVLGGRSD